MLNDVAISFVREPQFDHLPYVRHRLPITIDIGAIIWERNSFAIRVEERFALTIQRPESFVNIGGIV